MPDIIGWDIGGVHLKAARLVFEGGRLLGARSRVRYFELWRAPRQLAGAVRELERELGGGAFAHALTMTAELADCFASKVEGVRAVAAAACEALGAGRVRFFSLDRSFAGPDAVGERPLRFAASNWLATAAVAARRVGDGLLVDVGSTTSDLVPLLSGQPAPRAVDDTGRLAAGELVYAGVLRTPPAALAAEAPLDGGWCRLSPEPFATMADVYLVLGRIRPEQVTTPTADGRPATPGAARARLARLLCADAESLGARRIDGMARFLEAAQLAALERAARQVLSAVPASPDTAPDGEGAGRTLVTTGVGRFLAVELARRLGLRCRDLGEIVPVDDPQAAPAACVALLLAEERGLVR